MKLTSILVLVLAVVLVAGCTPKAPKKEAPVTTPSAVQSPAKEAPVKTEAPAAAQPAAEVWTCPMHPEVREAKAGKCPKCGMDLVKAAPAAPAAPAPAAPTAAAAPAAAAPMAPEPAPATK